MNVNNIHMQVLQKDRPMVDVDGRTEGEYLVNIAVMVMGRCCGRRGY